MLKKLFLVALAVTPSATLAEDWDRFSRGWGYALATEEACPDMWIKTDAVMGNHLSADGYARAQASVLDHRDAFARQVAELDCDEARSIVAAHLGYAAADIWILND